MVYVAALLGQDLPFSVVMRTCRHRRWSQIVGRRQEIWNVIVSARQSTIAQVDHRRNVV
jgi:hypothetical protein